MKTRLLRFAALAALLLAPAAAFAQSADRFPRPDFESGYKHPNLLNALQPPRSVYMEYVDVFLLLALLSAASYYSLKVVSRKAIFLLSVFAVAYFGFYREGCVCAIGAIQNVAMGLGPTGYVVPVTVMIIFLAPLIFALFFGRAYCASVCPLGAMQEMVIIRPIKVPVGIKHFLSLIPYAYLGVSVLMAYVGADFLICRWDPFVGFWRFGANFGMFMFGAAILAIGTVVARPYCRFLCPYSILLKWTSFFSKWHLKTTPTECIQCRLCEDSCPFDHLHKPTEVKEKEPRTTGVRRVAILAVSSPLIVATGMALGYLAHVPLSRMHPTVKLAERVALEKAHPEIGTTEESGYFYETSTKPETLIAEGAAIRGKVRGGALILGAFMGLVVACKLVNLSVKRTRTDYEPDRGDCYSCARCSDACSVGRVPLVAVGTLRDSLARLPSAPAQPQAPVGGRS
jgi:NosR/NirI family transcriptional regulator, nitrous oxide reductase regulator